MDQTEAYFGINSSMTFDTGNITGNLSEFYLSLSEDERKCLEVWNRKYWAFLLSSIGSFVVIVLSIFIWRAASNKCLKLRHQSVVTYTEEELTPGMEMQQIEERGVRQQNRTLGNGVYRDYITSAMSWGHGSMGELIGNIFLVLLCLATIGQVVVYFIDISKDHFLVEICAPLSQSLTQQIDLGLNIFFLAFFVKRFFDAPDKLIFMFDSVTFIDLFLIPPSFLAIFMERSWIGLRLIAELRLMRIPELLYYLRIIKTPATYYRVEPFAVYSTTLMCAAGVVHLLENMGDPWTEFTNAHHLSYLQCLYTVILALLTAGIYHSYCTTLMGRCFLVFIGLSFFVINVKNCVVAYRQRRQDERSKGNDEAVNV
ncbi:calcium-activated potassium channel slo-1 [Ditylenchus destructor]|nr:calcium-activated potassium channel slo-1 [Ditylenchus destructor]